MDLKTLNFEVNLEKLEKLSTELILPVRFIVRLLNRALELVTTFLARILGSTLIRHHFHLVLAGLVLVGPLLSLWVSKYNIFANSNHYLYRKFLRSAWGWTCIFTGSFILVLSLWAQRSLSLCLRHLSRLLVVGLLWWGCRHLLTILEDAAGTCYEPMAQAPQTSRCCSYMKIKPRPPVAKHTCSGGVMRCPRTCLSSVCAVLFYLKKYASLVNMCHLQSPCKTPQEPLYASSFSCVHCFLSCGCSYCCVYLHTFPSSPPSSLEALWVIWDGEDCIRAGTGSKGGGSVLGCQERDC